MNIWNICDGAICRLMSLTKAEQQLVLSTHAGASVPGVKVHCSLSSEADVDKRIKPATAAFGGVKNVFTNRQLDLKLKGRIYMALCLSILLYGSEV